MKCCSGVLKLIISHVILKIRNCTIIEILKIEGDHIKTISKLLNFNEISKFLYKLYFNIKNWCMPKRYICERDHKYRRIPFIIIKLVCINFLMGVVQWIPSIIRSLSKTLIFNLKKNLLHNLNQSIIYHNP